MRFISISAIVLLLLFSCNSKNKNTGNSDTKVAANNNDLEKLIEGTVDSIIKFKPVILTINKEHSDVDELIPVGINSHGTFAYLLDENTGGASGMQFSIVPSFQEFSLLAKFDMDEASDTIVWANKEMIYYSLKGAGIKLQNSIKKIPADSLQSQYGCKFDVKKTYGLPDSNDASGKKTLASIVINNHQGNMTTSEIINKSFTPSHGIYNVYISDYFVAPGEDGLFGYVVLVTEGLGFEGYTRKSIEVIPIGILNQH